MHELLVNLSVANMKLRPRTVHWVAERLPNKTPPPLRSSHSSVTSRSFLTGAFDCGKPHIPYVAPRYPKSGRP
jgi:hypothetical protein